MLKLSKLAAITAAGLMVLMWGAPAQSQANRTWVSGVGDDANPCSRTAPCKTFAGAISKTAAGGEIDALDPGGFGGVTITKAITLDGGSGQVASILVAGTNGISVSAGVNDTVIIRNLSINGVVQTVSPGTNGIKVFSGGAVHVDNTHIFGFGQLCIDFESTSVGAILVVDDSVLENCTVGGLLFKPTTLGRANINRTKVAFNGYGVQANDGARLTFTDSNSSSNDSDGILAAGTNSGLQVYVVNSVLDNNGAVGGVGSGVKATNTATVTLSNVDFFNNATAGITITGGAGVQSFGNNHNHNGGAPNVPAFAPQ